LSAAKRKIKRENDRKNIILVLAIFVLVIAVVQTATMLVLTGRATAVGTTTLCINHPPTINNVSNQEVYINHRLNFTASGADNDSHNLLFYDNFSGFDININSGIVNTTLNTSFFGNHSILITVADNVSGCSLNVSTSFNLSVLNHAPNLTLNIPDQGMLEDVTLTGLNLSVYFSDVDNQTLTYSAVSGTDVTVSITNDIASITPDPDYFGTSWVIFTANDSLASVTSNNVTLNINDTAEPSQDAGGFGADFLSDGDNEKKIQERRVERVVEQEIVEKVNLPSGENRFVFNQVETPIVKITFELEEALEQASVEVKLFDRMPREIIPFLPAVDYQYFEIDSSIKNENLINFKVLNEWVEKEDFIRISMFRYNNRVWNELNTRVISKDDIFTYYEAQSPGFSYFAIGGIVKTCEPNWHCNVWKPDYCEEGIDSVQRRECFDTNNCEIERDFDLVRDCQDFIVSDLREEEDSSLAGMAIYDKKKGLDGLRDNLGILIVFGIFVFVLLAIVFFFIFKKNKQLSRVEQKFVNVVEKVDIREKDHYLVVNNKGSVIGKEEVEKKKVRLRKKLF
jgi:PGF-pre-PGF domain-containing protein